MTYILIFILLWFVAGYIAAAASFAYFQYNRPYLDNWTREQDRYLAFKLLILGYTSLVVVFFLSHRFHCGFIWNWYKPRNNLDNSKGDAL